MKWMSFNDVACVCMWTGNVYIALFGKVSKRVLSMNHLHYPDTVNFQLHSQFILEHTVIEFQHEVTGDLLLSKCLLVDLQAHAVQKHQYLHKQQMWL